MAVTQFSYAQTRRSAHGITAQIVAICIISEGTLEPPKAATSLLIAKEGFMFHPKTALVASALLLLMTSSIVAQAQQREDSGNGWGIGLGVAIRDTLYAGENNHVQAFPYIHYEGKRFFVKGPMLGYKIVKGEVFTLSGFVAANVNSIDSGDFGAAELALRGIDRNLLEDRKNAADAGFLASFNIESAGEFELDVRGDITGASHGYQASVDYRYPFEVGPVTLIPGIGVTALSDKTANYYYGTLSKEVSRGVVDYKPGRATIPHIGMTAVLPMGSKWVGISGLSVDSYPTEVTDSPLIEKGTDVVPTFFIGAFRNF
jgi:MipA family protein